LMCVENAREMRKSNAVGQTVSINGTTAVSAGLVVSKDAP